MQEQDAAYKELLSFAVTAISQTAQVASTAVGDH